MRAWRRFWFDSIFGLLILGMVVVVLLRSFVFQIFPIAGWSMFPTFHDSDAVFVNRTPYWMDSPKHNDVIVFEPPGEASPEEIEEMGFIQRITGKRYYIKRVIGVEGDKIQIQGGVVYRNGQPLLEPYTHGRPSIEDQPKGLQEVPKGYLYVMGDNRTGSSDSRVFGFEPISRVVGRVDLRLWPLGTFGSFDSSKAEEQGR